MTIRGLFSVAIIAGAAALSGCWDTSDEVVLHEAGDYKGMNDPLLDSKATAEREDALKKRFQLVQIDR